MIFRRQGFLSKLQHLNVHLTNQRVLNTVPNQHYLEKELSKYFIFDFPQPPVFSQYSNFKSLLFIHTRFQRDYWRSESTCADSTCIINIHFCITLQYPAFVATLTCHPPASLMLLTNFILFPNPQMLFLSQSIWPLGFCALCTAGSGPWSIQPRTV